MTALLPVIPGLSYPVKRSPEVQGTRLQTVSGRGIWLPNFAYPIYHYEQVYNVLRFSQSEFQTLLGFYNLVKTTPGGYFYYNDPDDNSVTNQVIGVGNGSNTIFQSARTMGGFVEPIYGALNSGAVWKVNGSTVSASVDQNTGLVTFAGAPGNGLNVTWTGSYYWICEFEDDIPEFSSFMAQLYELQSLKFKSVRR